MNKKLIEDLIEILEYKEHDDFKKEQQQQWLNERLDILNKKWDDVYDSVVWFLTYDTAEHSIIKEKMDQFSVVLAKFVGDYKKEKEEKKDEK